MYNVDKQGEMKMTRAKNSTGIGRFANWKNL
jgi:hypothetical protein